VAAALQPPLGTNQAYSTPERFLLKSLI